MSGCLEIGIGEKNSLKITRSPATNEPKFNVESTINLNLFRTSIIYKVCLSLKNIACKFKRVSSYFYSSYVNICISDGTETNIFNLLMQNEKTRKMVKGVE